MPEDTAPEETGTEIPQTPQTPPTQEGLASPFGFQSYPSSKSEEPQTPSSPPLPEPQPPLAPPPPTQPSVQLPTQEPPAQTQPAQPTPEEPGEKGNFLSRLKKVLIILAVLVILAALGIFGYQTIVKRQSTSPGGQEESTPTPQALPFESPPPQGSSSFSSGVYQNSRYGFAIEPPTGWSEGSKPEGSVVLFQNPKQDQDESGNKFNANINIVVANEALSSNQTFDSYLEQVRRELAVLTEYKKISEARGTLTASEAFQIDITWKLGVHNVEQRQIFILRGKDVYILTATATVATWGQYLSIFEKSLGSFRFIPQR